MQQNFPIDHVYLIADSAGANLGLNVHRATKERDLRRPDKLVLISPWLDLRLTSESRT